MKKLLFNKLTVTLLIILGSVFIVFYKSTNPLKIFNNDVINLSNKADIKHINHISTFFDHGKKEISVSGTRKNKLVYGIFTNKNKVVNIINQKSGINRTRALKIVNHNITINKVTNISLGLIHRHQLVWSINYIDSQHNFRMTDIDFKTGKIITGYKAN